MSDDRILDDLARLAREDRARSEELERTTGDPVAARDEEEAFVRSVLAAGNDDALVASALQAVRTKAGPRLDLPEASPAVHRHETISERSAAPTGVAVPMGKPRPGRARVVAGLGAVAALAAGLLLYVKQADREPPLPEYEGLVTGADAPERADPQPGTADTSRIVVTRGAGLSLVARPKEPVTRPVAARAFRSCGGPFTSIAARVHVAETGAARIDGTPETLFRGTASGTCTLALVIAPEGQVPSEKDIDAPRRQTRVVKATFELQAE